MTGKTKEPVDLRADKIKQIVFSKSEGGKAPISIFDKEAVMSGTLVGEASANHGTVKSALLSDMESVGRELLSIRKGLHSEIQATSADFGQYIKSRYGFSSIDEMLRIGLGVEPSRATVMQFQTSSDFNLGYRWLIAELILAAVKQELVVPPIYKELVGKSVTISQNEIKVPVIGMVDAMPTVIGEADTIPTGSFKFGQKEATHFARP